MAGPACPKCGHNIPFIKTQWGLGKAFACRSCGARLVVSKAGALLAIALFILFWLLKERAESGLELAFLFGVLLIVALLTSWLFVKPRLAEQPPTA